MNKSYESMRPPSPKFHIVSKGNPMSILLNILFGMFSKIKIRSLDSSDLMLNPLKHFKLKLFKLNNLKFKINLNKI